MVLECPTWGMLYMCDIPTTWMLITQDGVHSVRQRVMTDPLLHKSTVLLHHVTFGLA